MGRVVNLMSYGQIVPSHKKKFVNVHIIMIYYQSKNKIIVTPDRPRGMKWFTTSTLVITGFCFLISAVGGLNYIFNPQSEEVLLLTAGIFSLGLILLFISLNDSIKRRIGTFFLSSPYIIEFAEKRILFKDAEEDQLKKVIPSSELETIQIDLEKETQRRKASPNTISQRISYPGTTHYRNVASTRARKFHFFTRIKSINMILKLKKGQKEIIHLGEYTDNVNAQKTMLNSILGYCRKKYANIELPVNSEVGLLSSKPQVNI